MILRGWGVVRGRGVVVWALEFREDVCFVRRGYERDIEVWASRGFYKY